VADLPDEVDTAAIDAAVEAAFSGGGDERVRAILVVHRGALVYERYSPNPADGPEVIAPSASLSKSVLSAFIGILARDERIDVTAPASVPEWHAEADDPRASITVEHMLHMATGIPWIEDPTEPNSNLAQMYGVPDMAAYAASLDIVDPPGSVFDYSSGTATVLARVLGEVVGSGPDETRAFMDRELFDKIGMAPVVTEFDAAGTWMAGFSADATARGFAKLGLLYVRGGAWDGEQIVPAGWVNVSRTPSPANAEYGAFWWLDPARPGVLLADGAFGQVIAVDPDHDLVVVQLGANLAWDGDRPLVDLILDAFAAAAPTD
jgi:CubicO group peptidase (beta-lactamase class C family)